MLTDSGGYQIFSLGHGSVSEEIKGIRKKQETLIKINEDGAIFRSYINGKTYCLTHEKSIQIQQKLGADLILVLDECSTFHVSKEYTQRSMLISYRWAERSLNELEKSNDGKQALYGVSQVGVYQDLRRENRDFINDLPFFGQAIGGSLDQSKEQMYDVVSFTMKHFKKIGLPICSVLVELLISFAQWSLGSTRLIVCIQLAWQDMVERLLK